MAKQVTDERPAPVAVDRSCDVKDPIEPATVEHFDEADEPKLSKPATEFDVLTHTIHLQDDPTLPAVTFRSMLIGLGLSVFGGVLSGIFYFKPQSVTIPAVFIAVVAFLLGEAMSRLIPRRDGWLGRLLNPGPFNVKEHLAVTIMANAASTSALGLQIVATERLYYDRRSNGALTFFMLISSQCLGYGMAGMMRRTMVYPAAMLWPANLPINAMLERLHSRAPSNRKPFRVFLYVFVGIFFWEIIPQWICPLLTGVSIFCLANRTSPMFTNIFGGAEGNEGLGLFSLCFDWQYISGGTSPLYFPVSSLISQGIGIAGCIILFTGVYYSNIWDAKKYPFLSQVIFSDTSTAGNAVQWNQTAAIGPDGRVNMTAVDELGLPNFAASNVLNILLTNMCIAAAITHLILWYPTELKAAVSFLSPRRILAKVKSATSRLGISSRTRATASPEATGSNQAEAHYDPHYLLMQSYKDCPDWWYAIVLVLSAAVALVVIYKSNSTLPWWGLLVACLVGYCHLLVFGSMQGITGVNFTIQSIIQMIGGYMRPGFPVANMYFSLYSYNTLLQGTLLAKDLKLAQYGHLAPRTTFAMQMIGTVVGAGFNYLMANSIIDNQADILRSVQGTNIWSGAVTQQFNAQAVTFGGFPHELFDVGSRYQWVPLATLIGFFVPLPFWYAHRRWPRLGFDLINTPVIMFYLCYLNLGINSSVMTFFMAGFFAQWYLRRNHPNIFVKYNYLVSAALDGGTSVMVFILSFAVLGAAKAAIAFPKYWGNPADGHIDYCYKSPSE
ncbi:oligopeptide transporter [Cordyceps fumosorosea ARSEF 2679]|uniref:Oligopeptide transporter n=1 Tax=Cordyceps fumosorosea (strain ARSEF 2679) TaxID=1081104 RepID=A0A162LP43_CORFA|nr:oligopeptide transporter [Cordyceps fumosorosea ARSEF 2679]OAA73584.1 oligopeptide transporter [Cordyceps fumosorosea ARSEF 2679]